MQMHSIAIGGPGQMRVHPEIQDYRYPEESLTKQATGYNSKFGRN